MEIEAYFLACLTQDGVKLKKTLDVDTPEVWHGVPQRRKFLGFPATAPWLVRQFQKVGQSSRKESVCENEEYQGRGLHRTKLC